MNNKIHYISKIIIFTWNCDQIPCAAENLVCDDFGTRAIFHLHLETGLDKTFRNSEISKKGLKRFRFLHTSILKIKSNSILKLNKIISFRYKTELPPGSQIIVFDHNLILQLNHHNFTAVVFWLRELASLWKLLHSA